MPVKNGRDSGRASITELGQGPTPGTLGLLHQPRHLAAVVSRQVQQRLGHASPKTQAARAVRREGRGVFSSPFVEPLDHLEGQNQSLVSILICHPILRQFPGQSLPPRLDFHMVRLTT